MSDEWLSAPRNDPSARTWLVDELLDRFQSLRNASPARRHNATLAQVSVLGREEFRCPLDTTSTFPSTTSMAVSSLIAYAGPDKPPTHGSLDSEARF
jgi:hypothetical protein